MARLKKEVPQLKWIDLDCGQIDNQKERPGVAFPCVVIGITINNCEDQYSKVQICRAQVSIRIAQNPPVSRTSSEAADDARESSMARYQLIEDVYVALQGYGTPEFNPLSRRRQFGEKRTDGLFVYRIDFETEYQEIEVGD